MYLSIYTASAAIFLSTVLYGIPSIVNLLLGVGHPAAVLVGFWIQPQDEQHCSGAGGALQEGS